MNAQLLELIANWRADSLLLGESDGYGAQLDRCADELEAAMQAQQGAEPVGFVLVPREPTQAMVDAGSAARWGRNNGTSPSFVRKIYAALIEAAPATGAPRAQLQKIVGEMDDVLEIAARGSQAVAPGAVQHWRERLAALAAPKEAGDVPEIVPGLWVRPQSVVCGQPYYECFYHEHPGSFPVYRLAAPSKEAWAGFVLVPREPTDAMHKAAWDACDNSMPMAKDWHQFNGKVYAAMLAAANPPGDQRQEGECRCPEHGSWIAADDVKRLTRTIDVAINGEAGAAKQASLCDVTSQIVAMCAKSSPPPEAAVTRTEAAVGESLRYERHPLLRQHAAQSVAKSGSGAILVSAAAVDDLFADLDAQLTALAAPTGPQPAGGGVDAAMVERAMNARIPGGSQAWVWLFNCEGGMQPEAKHRDWFRRVLLAALKGGSHAG